MEASSENGSSFFHEHHPTDALYSQPWSLFHTMIPDEMQLHIFQQLDIHDLGRAAQACRLWHDIAMDRSLWAEGLAHLPKEGGPSARVCHTSVIINNKIYIYGGHNPSPGSNYITDVKSDLLCYDLASEKWSPIIAPLARKTEHAAIVYKNQMLLVCGYTAESYCNSILSYDFESNTWNEFVSRGEGGNEEDVPAPRSACSVAIWEDKLFMFGGWSGHNSRNDFWVYDLIDHFWREIPTTEDTPSPRRSHCAIQYRDAMYIWGGYGIDGNCDTDVHKFDFTTQTWSIVPTLSEGPKPRSRARAVRLYDRMIVMGGWDRVDHFDDWWEFNLNDGIWIRRHVRLPHPIAQHSAVAYKNNIIVFGGFDDAYKRSTDMFWNYSVGHLNAKSA